MGFYGGMWAFSDFHVLTYTLKRLDISIFFSFPFFSFFFPSFPFSPNPGMILYIYSRHLRVRWAEKSGRIAAVDP